MGDKTFKPRAIGIIDQVLSPGVAELGHVAKRVSDWLRSLAFSAMLGSRPLAISDPGLVHASELLLSLPVEALQHQRHQGLPVQCLVPSSPAKWLGTLA